MLRRRHQRGLTLTELLIASALGLVLATQLVLVYARSVGASARHLGGAYLNQELRAAMQVITRDLRRAGYWAVQPGPVALQANPFMAADNQVATGQANGEPQRSCITFAYDLNEDGLVGVGSQGLASASTSTLNVEQFGYRLHLGALEMRTGSQPFACDAGLWEDLTTAQIEITRLEFDLAETCLNLLDPASACSAGVPAQILREVGIRMAGRLASDPDSRHEIMETVRLRNDRYVP